MGSWEGVSWTCSLSLSCFFPARICLMAFSFCLCILKKAYSLLLGCLSLSFKKNSSMTFIEPCLLNSVPGSRCMPFCCLMRLIRLPFFVLRSCCSVLWLFCSSCRSCESCLGAVLFVVRLVQAPVNHLRAVLFDEGCLSATHHCPTYPQAYLKENVWGALLK